MSTHILTTIAGVPSSADAPSNVRVTPSGQAVAINPKAGPVRNFEKGTTPLGKGRKTLKRMSKKRKTRRRHS